MSHTKPELIKSFLPIFYISKLFGCNLYKLPDPVTATSINSRTAIDALICVVHIVVNLIIVIPHVKTWESYNSVFSFDYATKSGYSGMVVIVFIGQIIAYAITIANCFITILALGNATITRKILFSLIKFDEEVLNIGMAMDSNYNRTISWSYALITLLLQIPTFFLTLTITRARDDSTVFLIIATHFGYSTNMGCMFSYLTTFWYIFDNIANRFRSINKYLRQRIENKQKGYHTNDRKTSTTDCSNKHCLSDPAIVCNLSENYQKLVDVISELSKSNALQLIWCIAILFLSSIVTVFMFYLRMTDRISNEPPIASVFYSIRLLVHFFLLYKAISVGGEIRKQKNIVLSLLNKAMSLEQSKLTLLELNHFRYQVEHSKMAVTCGIFTIDWTLMYTLGTAMTTYLILFMQFDSISIQNNILS